MTHRPAAPARRARLPLPSFLPILVLQCLLLAGPAAAADAPPAGVEQAPAVLERFYGVLLDSMRDAKRLGIDGRYRKLDPAVRAAFDLQAMTRIAVGPTWPTIPAPTQTAIVDAFSRMSVATYASRFDGFSGEKFSVDPAAERRGNDAIVHTKLAPTDREPVTLNYLLHQVGGEWKIVDVYLNGTISELATRRTEFSALLKRGSADALAGDLRARADKMLAAQ